MGLKLVAVKAISTEKVDIHLFSSSVSTKTKTQINPLQPGFLFLYLNSSAFQDVLLNALVQCNIDL